MPNLTRMHRLQVNGRFADGRLLLAVKFSRNLNDRKSIERFADRSLYALRSFVSAEES